MCIKVHLDSVMKMATVKAVKNKVREILGVDGLVDIRDYLVQESAKVARETVKK